MATCRSTSWAVAPGMETSTSARGTTIWGSSSLGVMLRATAPAIRLRRMRSTERFPVRKVATILFIQL